MPLSDLVGNYNFDGSPLGGKLNGASINISAGANGTYNGYVVVNANGRKIQSLNFPLTEGANGASFTAQTALGAMMFSSTVVKNQGSPKRIGGLVQFGAELDNNSWTASENPGDDQP